MILLVAIIVVKSQVVTSLTFVMIFTQASVNFIILQLSLNITARSRLMIEISYFYYTDILKVCQK